mgnify:CR=1 FL=1
MMKIDMETCTTYRVALLGMWCDKVLTNAEYDRISNRLNEIVKEVEEKDERRNGG